MFKEVVDPFRFQQAIDEIEVTLAVLDAVFSLLVGPQRHLHVREAIVGANLFHDFGNRLLLKDAGSRPFESAATARAERSLGTVPILRRYHPA